MADQHDEVTRLLRAHYPDWHVVEPVRGGIRGKTLIQNKAGKKVEVPIARKDVDDRSGEELVRRIGRAVAKH